MTAVHPGLPALPHPPLRIVELSAFVFRSPVDVPVRTSFGVMTDRPAVFVRARDADGTEGWGEIWCNFPACGAEHRARLLDTLVAPLLLNRDFDGPADAWAQVTAQTAVLAIQTGEPGPIAQVIAGVDLALWDLAARRARLPLYRYLGGQRASVPVYASGINPDQPQRLVAAKRAEGFTGFKLKIGFGQERDLANIAAIRAELRPGERLMLDANQAWSLPQALEMLPRLTGLGLGWLEEPLRADRPLGEWQQLQAQSAVPLAAGENLMGRDAFAAAIGSGALSVIQPDLAKWGGISGCWPVIGDILAAGRSYCPHYLGAGIGQLASAHVLAACGGDGRLEIDANINPLRSSVAPVTTRVVDGSIALEESPGIGVVVDPAALTRLCQAS